MDVDGMDMVLDANITIEEPRPPEPSPILSPAGRLKIVNPLSIATTSAASSSSQDHAQASSSVSATQTVTEGNMVSSVSATQPATEGKTAKAAKHVYYRPGSANTAK